MNGSIRVRWSNAQAMTVDQVVPGGDLPQPAAEAGQLARLEQFVSTVAAGEFHNLFPVFKRRNPQVYAGKPVRFVPNTSVRGGTPYIIGRKTAKPKQIRRRVGLASTV